MPHKLLLADDSVTIQRVIELTFADEDVDVVAVSDGDQAIARLEADPPDIVLADVGMPGKDGYAVAAYVKRSDRLAHIPVVLLTGAFEPIDKQRADAAGCDGVLAKPFEPQLVISRVKELLARNGRPTAVDVQPAPRPQPVPVQPPPAAAQQPLPAVAPQVSARSIELDGYFDRLDAAFASLPNRQPSGEPPDLPLSFASPESAFSHQTAESIVPVSETPSTPGGDLPLSRGASAPTFAAVRSSSGLTVVTPPAPAPLASAPAQPTGASVRTRHAETPVLPVVPSLADAFAALLASERSATPAQATWPVAPVAPPAITDEMIEEVVRRVLDRLSDRVVRETVAGIVSGVAERLVREEIEKIKARFK